MKLVLQIALGILVSGVVPTLLWLGIFAAAVPRVIQPVQVVVDAPRPLRSVSRYVPPVSACVNYVQMQGGERRCLENLPRAEIRLEGRGRSQ